MPASIPASSPSRLPHHTAAQGSSSSSSPSRAGPGAAHDSWVRNYESVEYEIPLLDPHGQLDSSGDEDDEAENISGGMDSQTDQPPPRTPPKNPSLSPKRDGNASAEPRSHSRKPSSISSASPSSPTPQYRNLSPPTPMTRALRASASENDKDQGGVVRDGQIAARAGGSGGGSASAGVSGSPRIPNTGSVMTDISHQSSLSSPTTTAVLPSSTSTPSTPTPPPPASRSPRSSSFKSSPLAASVSVLSGANNNNNHNNPTTTSGSNSSSLFSNPNSSTSAPAMNVSSSMSNPHSVGNSSSSSSSTPPSSFFQSGQGSSSGQNLPSMPNTPYSQYAHGHPNPNSPPFAKQGTRPSMNHNNNNNSHMNPAAYPQPPRITSGNNDETRALVGEGGSGSGRASPLGSGFMPTATALRDPPPPASMTNNHLYGHHPPGNANHPPLTSSGSRGSMILYRLSANEDGTLPPPGVPAGRRTSVYSNSGDSIVSLSGDSKYPLVGFGNGHGGSGTRTPGTPGRPGTPGTPNNGSIGNRGGELSMSEIGRVHGGLVAYMYDPGQDLDADELDEEEEEWVKMVGGHVPRSPRGGELKGFGSFGNANVRMDMSGKNGRKGQHGQQGPAIRTSKHTPPPTGGIPWRGLINVSTLIVGLLDMTSPCLLLAVLSLYVAISEIKSGFFALLIVQKSGKRRP